jgi:hypothetical protein
LMRPLRKRALKLVVELRGIELADA